MIFIAGVELTKESKVKKIKHGLNIYIKNYILELQFLQLQLHFGINRKGSLTLQK